MTRRDVCELRGRRGARGLLGGAGGSCGLERLNACSLLSTPTRAPRSAPPVPPRLTPSPPRRAYRRLLPADCESRSVRHTRGATTMGRSMPSRPPTADHIQRRHRAPPGRAARAERADTTDAPRCGMTREDTDETSGMAETGRGWRRPFSALWSYSGSCGKSYLCIWSDACVAVFQARCLPRYLHSSVSKTAGRSEHGACMQVGLHPLAQAVTPHKSGTDAHTSGIQ